MRSPRPFTPPPSQITPREVYLQRRRLLQGLLGLAVAGGNAPIWAAPALDYRRNPALSTTEPRNSREDITAYNNFYEVGTDKGDPARLAGRFRPSPWSVTVAGEAGVTGTFTLEDILKPHALEERIYRLRCVEGWSMVIPWVGIPLGSVLKRFQPTSRAKYVAFKPHEDFSDRPWFIRPMKASVGKTCNTLSVPKIAGSSERRLAARSPKSSPKTSPIETAPAT